MPSNAPLRDPFATEDEPSGSNVGRPPARALRLRQAVPPGQANQLSGSALFSSRPPNPPPWEPPRYSGSLGAPRSRNTHAEHGERGNASTSTPSAPPSLSLGLPRSRMPPKRGNEPGSSDLGAQAPGAAQIADDAVRNTDSDALLSRLSALKLGYLTDEPYTQEFSTSAASSSDSASGWSSRPGFSRSPQPDPSTRRSPLINIGTYLRCSTIDHEVESFLKDGEGPKQIISIGAGSDSRYWRIMSNPELVDRLHCYVEIDFAENTSQKLSRILRSSILRSQLDTTSTVYGTPLTDLAPGSSSPLSTQGSGKRLDVLRSSKYTLLAADVRNLHPDTPAASRISPDVLLGTESCSLDSRLPTLVLFECVLAYIAPEKADWLIRLLGERFTHIQALSYDIALAGDAENSAQDAPAPSCFGKVMLQNLEMRKLNLEGAKAYATIDSQSQRFVRAWAGSRVEASGQSLFSIWTALDAGQKQRLSRLEGLDEVEEIDMLLKHYCIVQAKRIG